MVTPLSAGSVAAHGVEQRGDELLGPVDAVEARGRAEGIIDADASRLVGVTQLLEHGVWTRVANWSEGKSSTRRLVSGQGGPGDHIEERADGGRAHVRSGDSWWSWRRRRRVFILVAGHDVGASPARRRADISVLQEGLAISGTTLPWPKDANARR